MLPIMKPPCGLAAMTYYAVLSTGIVTENNRLRNINSRAGKDGPVVQKYITGFC